MLVLVVLLVVLVVLVVLVLLVLLVLVYWPKVAQKLQIKRNPAKVRLLPLLLLPALPFPPRPFLYAVFANYIVI